MLEWMEEGDRMSFDDSDRFEEDSLCSWGSEPESLCNNWRGWKKPLLANSGPNAPLLASNQRRAEDGSVLSLAELCSRVVAAHIAFEVVEQAWQPVPEPLQLRIAFWSFPDNEEDIRLYSCLANGAADEFNKGENLYKSRAVKEPLQIGFHLSATVVSPQQTSQGKSPPCTVAVTFDRRRITSCSCSCDSKALWCAHVVAVCLYRIHQSHLVTLRAPVSESLSRLQRDQLQKFAQYLISELPQQILPTAQRLLDELLSTQPSAINTVCGAPDPTAGASASEQTSWCLDENTLHENIRKILIKFCVPSPTVFSDVNYLSSTAPPAAAEWSSLLRPLRGREPEGMWNLLSIVREMFKRHDRNAVPLLEVLSEEIMSCEQIMVWWFNTKVALHNGSAGGYGQGTKSSNLGSQSQASQHACSSLCDEVIVLWRLAALNPGLSAEERDLLRQQFSEWHMKVVDKVSKSKGVNHVSHGGSAVLPGNGAGPSTPRRTSQSFKVEMEVFPGFKPAIEACYLSWDDYPVPGVTYSQGHRLYHCPFTCFRHSETHGRIDIGQINSSSAVIKNDLPAHVIQRRVAQGEYGLMLEEVQRENGAHNGLPSSSNNRPGRELDRAGNRSSVSSEGFCENEGDPAAEAAYEPAEMRDLSRQDSDDPALGSDTNEPEPIAADSCNSTDKEKSSPEDFDADSDWSGVGARNVNSSSARVANSTEAQTDPCRFASDASAPPASFPLSPAQVPLVRDPGAVSVPNRGAFGELKPLDDPLEILFSRAEGLHAHGHSAQACELGVQLASEMLANPPDLLVELPPIITKNGKKKKTNPACHQISCLASATLAKCAFLCTVLAENQDHYHLAFRVGMFGLELARPPATTKPLEVKLAHQESELVTLLKRIPLGHAELTVLREKAEQLRDGVLRTRGDALLPLSLATFIFEALVTASGTQQVRSPFHATHRLPTDETLGFEAAVAALGLKANVSEADHPLLCEGTRRQRGDLAVMLLVHYKDDPDKLAKIMEKLLDRQVHPLYKAPLLSSFYTNNPTPMGQSCAFTSNRQSQIRQRRESIESGMAAMALESNASASRGAQLPQASGAVGGPRDQSPSWEEDYANWQAGQNSSQMAEGERSGLSGSNITSSRHTLSTARNRSMSQRTQRQATGPGSDSGSSGSGKSSGSDSFGSRGPPTHPPPCNSREAGAPPGNVASVSCAIATFPEDGGTLGHGPVNASSSIPTVMALPHPQAMPELGGHMNGGSAFGRSASGGMGGIGPCAGVGGGGKVNRFKNKRLYPSVPNQPSEASAHFMFELAKTVLAKAGGNSSTSLFTQPINSQNPRGPIRALQMCAFQIGLYALGLHNCVSAKWLSRTYSSHVSWITGQAMEIGSQAVWFLISTWEGHLTPPEVASIADRASRGHEANMVRAAAELALSCLPHAHALNPNEIQRAILQCKEQSSEMLERACLAVESAAKGGGVYPEVLFCVARCWHELYEQRMPSTRRGRLLPSVEQPPPPIPLQVPPCSMQQPQANMAGVGVPVPYPMASIVPFPLAYSFLSGTAPGPNPPPQISGVPVYLPAPNGGAGAGPNATFSYAPPIPGLQYFSSVTCPLPMGPPSAPPNPPPGPSPLMPMSVGATQGTNSRPPPPVPPPGCQVSLQPLVHSSNNPAHHAPPSLFSQQPPPPPPPMQQQQQPNSIRSPSASGNVVDQAPTPTQLQFLLAAYRVGIVALETLGRRAHDDRPQARYSRNPPYGEDVKWLLSVAKKLGTEYLQQFCVVTVTSVVSPFVLHEIAIEAAHFFAYTGSAPPNPYMQHLRSRVLTPLIQKCHQMYIQCVNHKLYHLNPSDYEDFLSIVQAARSAFHLIPTGPMQFNEFLQSIQKSKSCTKELWGRLMAIVRQPAV